jgi:hypothetical protein
VYAPIFGRMFYGGLRYKLDWKIDPEASGWKCKNKQIWKK